jgi:hypothetical protein
MIAREREGDGCEVWFIGSQPDERGFAAWVDF